MTNLFYRIVAIYPELTLQDFFPVTGTICIRNESDGNGEYIAKWEHPTLPRPTDEQLQGATS